MFLSQPFAVESAANLSAKIARYNLIQILVPTYNVDSPSNLPKKYRLFCSVSSTNYFSSVLNVKPIISTLRLQVINPTVDDQNLVAGSSVDRRRSLEIRIRGRRIWLRNVFWWWWLVVYVEVTRRGELSLIILARKLWSVICETLTTRKLFLLCFNGRLSKNPGAAKKKKQF